MCFSLGGPPIPAAIRNSTQIPHLSLLQLKSVLACLDQVQLWDCNVIDFLLKWVLYICWLHFFTTHSETPCNLASATASLVKIALQVTNDGLFTESIGAYFSPLMCFSFPLACGSTCICFPPTLWAFLLSFWWQIFLFHSNVTVLERGCLQCSLPPLLVITHFHGFNCYLNTINSPVLTSADNSKSYRPRD